MLIITAKFRLWVYSKKIFAKLIHRSQTPNTLYGTPTWILENAPLIWIFIINGKSSQAIGDGHLVFSNRYLFWKVSTVWFKKYCSKIIPLYIVAFTNGLEAIDKTKTIFLNKIPQYSVGAITYPCLRYLLLATKSSYMLQDIVCIVCCGPILLNWVNLIIPLTISEKCGL